MAAPLIRAALPCAALLCAALLATAATAAGPAAGAAPKPVPTTRLATAQDLRAELAALRGNVVIVNLWATWCVPCLREVPDLVALQAELAPRGVVLLGVGMDEPDQLAGLVEPFRAKQFPKLRTLLRSTADMDTVVSVLDPAWNEILPTTYLVDRDGRVAKKIQGRRTVDEFRAMIEDVLGPR
ncbi:MAG: TlpA disulfide reductase family protein [Steroidobacteraceae bacterium]